MMWFGRPWGAPLNREGAHVPVPDWPCLSCGRPFTERDRGVVTPFVGDPSGRGKAAYHLECFATDLDLPKVVKTK